MGLNPIATGERLLCLGRFEEALDCFDAHLSQADDLQALFGRAVAQQMLGWFHQAEQDYAQVLSVEPNHEEALSNLIAMSVELFDLDRLEHYSRWLLDVNGKSAPALQGLAVVALERRDYDAAAHYFSYIVPANGPEGDAIEYRVSREIADRLRSGANGAVAHPY